jgi:tetratricopeptide (TPR) repeat protein
MGDYEGAVRVYWQAIQRDERDPRSFDERGLALMALHRFDEALADFVGAIKLAPGEAAYDYHLGRASQAYVEAGDFAAAVQWQTKAVEQTPQGDPQRKGMNARLDLYRHGVPYREGPEAGVS